MNRRQSSGCGPWLLIPFGFLALLVLRQMLPMIFKILLTGLGILALVVGLLVFLVIYFSKKSNQKGSAPTAGAQKDPYTAHKGGGTDTQQTVSEDKPPEEKSHCTLEQTRILNKAGGKLMELRGIASRIKDPNVRKRSEDVCDEMDQILTALRRRPADIARMQQFLNYYLPGFGKVILGYLRKEEEDAVRDDFTLKTMAWLRELQSAMERQCDALYEKDMVDLTAEMEAMTLALKRDGLLINEDFVLKDGDREIHLTL